jgi:hypothetical protein
MERHVVDDPGPEVLLGHVRAACDRDVLVSGCGPRLLERALRPVGDEVEGRPALLLDRFALMVRENEDGDVERRIVAPPGVGVRVLLPRAGPAAEHPPAHDHGPDAIDACLEEVAVGPRLAAFASMRLAPGCKPGDPFVELLASFAQRLFEGLVRPGDVPIERHGDVDEDSHFVSFLCRFGYEDLRRARNSSART